MADAVPIPVIGAGEAFDWLRADGLALTDEGTPLTPLTFVDLDSGSLPTALTAPAHRVGGPIVIGLRSAAAPDPAAQLFTLTLTTARAAAPWEATVSDLPSVRRALALSVNTCPRAALTLDGLLRLTSSTSVDDGLVAESLAYSMLLGGHEFARWRARHPSRSVGRSVDESPAVLTERIGRRLGVTLNRRARRNAYSREMRDGLVEALDLAWWDSDIESVVVTGNGESFCSGGDLDEFGGAGDLGTAHLVRLDRSAASRVHRIRERVEVRVHGACVGAGVEVPSFAGRVCARDDAFFQLPELSMGLVPGAGGTVGITRRIGRWRTAYLALTGERIDAATALSWGLVDERC